MSIQIWCEGIVVSKMHFFALMVAKSELTIINPALVQQRNARVFFAVLKL